MNKETSRGIVAIVWNVAAASVFTLGCCHALLTYSARGFLLAGFILLVNGIAAAARSTPSTTVR